MEKKQFVIAFRGRNTENILRDAGMEADIVICREGDTLRQEGDLTQREAEKLLDNAAFSFKEEVERIIEEVGKWDAADLREISILLIGNGGTTEQQIPFLQYLFGGWDGWWGSYKVIQVERDGAQKILAERKNAASQTASSLSKKEAYELYNHTSW